METLKNINRSILTTLMQMEKTFPELYRFVGEMPDSYSENTTPKRILENLEEYYHSLTLVLKKYAKTHTAENQPALAK